MKENKKVSVVIPMYNAEPFIRQCLESVLEQTWKELEVIVVDDGSTDRSLELCRKIAAKDGRLRVVTQENKGVSAARNRGLEEASGEYVFFLDSDDGIHRRLLEEMVGLAEKAQGDLVFCHYVKVADEQMDGMLQGKADERQLVADIAGDRQETEEWFHSRYHRDLSCIGGKLIRRRFLGDQRFDESLWDGEDTVFLYQLCSRDIRLVHCCREWYYYRAHEDSLSHLNERIRNRHSFRAYEMIRDQEYAKKDSPWAQLWEYRFVWDLLSKYLVVKQDGDRESSLMLENRVLEEMKHPLYREFSVGRKMLFGGLFLGCNYVAPVRWLWGMKRRGL